MPDIKSMRERVRNLTVGGRWYEIKNADTDTAVVRIYSEIGVWGVTEEDFARDLAGVTAGEIEVQISSPGGDVFAGVAIFNALRAHSARITTRVDGVAASIASVIAQAGDHRVMLGGSQMMIHQAHGIAMGPASEMREFADLLDRQNENIAAIYAARSGGKVEDFAELLAGGTNVWLSAAEAVELGLADEVVEPASKDKPKDAALDPVWAERFQSLEQAIAALKTSPADKREELTPEPSEVTSEQAERLLASITLKEK
jgi:ATP-dependent Clp endopeptidase proteolytic subunit ClpP